MNKNEYLRRIKIEKNDLAATLENLKLLQRQHLLRVPFENLDIHWKRPIVLDTENFYQKIVENNRGGFCYELNGLFYRLLTKLGFQSKIISARVSQGNGEFSPEYDHLAILTQIGDEGYFVDVGFGSFIAEPLKFVLDVEQIDQTGIYKIKKYDEDYFQIVKKNGENWTDEIIFKTVKRDLTEFTAMCEFHQTSPESHFMRNKVCSLMTPTGRKTLTDNRFIETKNGEKHEFPVESVEDFDQMLEREFYIKKTLKKSNFLL